MKTLCARTCPPERSAGSAFSFRHPFTRISLAAAFVLLAFSLNAQAPDAVPVSGEHHHHLEIENSFVRAYYVELPPHESTLLHRHELDYIFVSLGPSDIMNAPLGKPELHQALKNEEMHFARGGLVHVARNLSDKPFRNLTIAFVHPQQNVRNRCEKIIDGPLNDCPTSAEATAKSDSVSPGRIPLFETDEIFGELLTLAPHVKHTEAKAKYAALLLGLEDAHLKVHITGQSSVKLGSGGILWLPANRDSDFSATGKTPARYILLYFKDSPADPKP